MSVWQAIILGVVQGVTEFLPVSSSGHLVIFPELFDWSLQDVAFDAAIHLATLLAMVIYFRDDLVKIVRGMLGSGHNSYKRLGYDILIASIPVAVVGYLFGGEISALTRRPEVVLGSLLLWGVVLILADAYRDRNELPIRKVIHIGWKRAFGIGCAQVLALIPGTSRSGITISAGLFAGLGRHTAARFAFLLGMPAIALASGKAFLDIFSGEVLVSAGPLLIGFLAAFLSGLVAIDILLHLLGRFTYKAYGVYRVVLALAL